jgi:hypothetical protein
MSKRNVQSSDLPNSVVIRSPMMASGSALDILTLYPEDFGAPGDNSSTDDAAAFQALIDYAVAQGYPRIRIRLGSIYNFFSSSPRTDRQGNAIIALPDVTGAATLKYIEFYCAGDWTSINIGTSVGHTPVYSATYGPPSWLGGPTTEQLGANGTFATCIVEISGHMSMFMPSNPTLSGIDLGRMQDAVISGQVKISAGSGSTQPTNPMFGVRMPEGLNGAQVEANYIGGLGLYAAVVFNSAHFNAKKIAAQSCVIGAGITGNAQVTANDGHSSHISMLSTQECKYHIASFSPSAGAISAPTGDVSQITISLWDIEDYAAGEGYPTWTPTVDHVLDANNTIRGRAQYARVVSGTGPVSGPLTLSGAKKLRLADMTLSAHQGACALAAGSTAGGSPPAPAAIGVFTDLGGICTFGTGTGASGGQLLTGTFTDAFQNAPMVSVQAMNAATAALGVTYVSSSTTGWAVSFPNAPASSQTNTVYSVSVAVVPNPHYDTTYV